MIDLCMPIGLNIIAACAFYLLEKHTSFSKIKCWYKQVIIGIVFGAIAVYASGHGIYTTGVVASVCDAMPLTCGLIFGAPAGIIAGLIGGLAQWFSIYTGVSAYTRFACSAATILAGLIAAAFRKWLFDNKKATWGYGVFLAVICEVIHMILIFLTNMSDASNAFTLVKALTTPMIAGNAIAAGVPIIIISLLAHDKRRKGQGRERIAQTFQRWLLVCISIAFLFTSRFTYDLQNRMTQIENSSIISIAISDVEKTMQESPVETATKNRHIGQSGQIIVCDENQVVIYDKEEYCKPLSDYGINVELSEMTEGKLYDVTFNETEYLMSFKKSGDYYIIGYLPYSEAMFMRDASLYTSVFMQILIFGTLFIFIYFLIKRVIINNMKKVNGTLNMITEGNLDVTVDVRSNEEFSSLSDDINMTVATLKRYIDETAARIDRELEYAKKIQNSALPTDIPSTEFYGIDAAMFTAKEVGGDFYDFYQLGEHRVAILIADVSGKGIPAAMFMMQAKTIIKDLAESGLELNDVFTTANDKLCEGNDSGMFVTAWMGVLDTANGELEYVNAGHNPPMIMKAGEPAEGFKMIKAPAGFVLAGMEGIKYKKNVLKLEAGDKLFLYTDGVTEATNVRNELYGEERLMSFLTKNEAMDACEILPELKADIDAFCEGAPQFDDITMLAFEYHGCKAWEETREFDGKLEALPGVMEFFEGELEKAKCPMKTTFAISVVVEEIFTNIAKYAYRDVEGGMAHVRFAFNPASREAVFEFVDEGPYFNPLESEDPDITLSADEREIGGLGIFITKKTMDEIEYRRDGEKNVLVMMKKI